MTKKPAVCSFCGKSELEVAKLVAGPQVYICNECVGIARRVMTEEDDTPLPDGWSEPGDAKPKS